MRQNVYIAAKFATNTKSTDTFVAIIGSAVIIGAFSDQFRKVKLDRFQLKNGGAVIIGERLY